MFVDWVFQCSIQTQLSSKCVNLEFADTRIIYISIRIDDFGRVIPFSSSATVNNGRTAMVVLSITNP